MPRLQRTLKGPVTFEGVGLHTGRLTHVTVSPSTPNTGVRFFRSDLNAGIPCSPLAVSSTSRSTTLSDGKGAEVHTIEHFLAAASGLGLDNLRVEMDGPEMPILDGSSLPFLKSLRSCGVVEQPFPVSPLRVTERVEVTVGNACLTAEPVEGEYLELAVDISFPRPGLESLSTVFRLADGVFERDLAGARTFCLKEEVDALRSQGLIQGATLDCGLVFGAEGLMNGPLRYPDEPVRHKTVDLLGDLMLLNRPVWGRITASKAGHRSHVELAKALLDRFGKSAPAPSGGPRGDTMMDILEIQKILPHRYPFLMIDRVLEVEQGRRAVAIKNVTGNEPQFEGHFPGHPIMPGVLLVEAMAQTGGVALMSYLHQGKIPYFAKIDEARFRLPVRPGDQVRLEVEITSQKSMIFKMSGKALVDGLVVCEAQFTCALVPADNGGRSKMSKPPEVHPTAIVDPKAELADGVVVGPHSLVGPHVRIGEGTVIGNNVVIEGRTTIGKRNRIFTGAVLGSEPQDVKFAGEVTYLEIGDDNVIREYATVNPGTGEGAKTVVGNDTWLMMNTHVAHNCVIGNHVKLANVVALAGHVRVDDYAIVGGLTPVHQYVRIGRNVMIGGGLRVPQDVVPYTLAGGEPLEAHGLNTVGLERCGFSPETIKVLKDAYRIIFRKKLTTADALKALQADIPQLPEVQVLIDFLSTSQRGFTR